MTPLVPRDYQLRAVEHAEQFFDSAGRGSRLVIAAPTGSGKSVVESTLKSRRGPGHWLITPRLSIIRGILSKEGVPDTELETERSLIAAAWDRRCITPIRFLHALERGDIPEVTELVIDEGHHSPATTYERIQLLTGMPPCLLLTATPYRGTARGTARFLQEWPDIVWMITLREAAQRGDVAIPVCRTMPLVDDDVIELNSSGEFEVRAIVSAYASRLEDLAEQSLKFLGEDGLWRRFTCFAMPSVETAEVLACGLQRRGAPAAVVSADTSYRERLATFDLAASRGAALVQVATIGEGVDLPIRVLIDARPTMSPVSFMQLLGRSTRPVPTGEPRPEYWSTCRNLQRHAYLLDGLVPSAAIAAAEAAFGGPGKRGGYRALGLEAIGRFKAAEVRCLDGCTALVYSLVDESNGRNREYACLVHPASAEPVWAERVHGVKADQTRDWGHWTRCTPPVDLRGFGSVSPKDPSEKMCAWFKRAAEGRGLDPNQRVTRKSFQALPLLLDLGIKFRSPAT